MKDLNDIRVFLNVAELGSFAAAARVLSMTAPSVTRAISALEERLGVQLFVRTTRQVSLTSAGAVYAARMRPLLQAFDDAAEEVREQEAAVSGHIRLNAPLSLGQQVLPDVLSGFRAENPAVSLSITLTDSFVDIVTAPYDLAIRISGPPDDKSTIWRKLCPIRRVLVASPGYLAANGAPQNPDDLQSASCLAFDAEAVSENWELTNAGRRRRVRAGSVLAGNNGELLARLAENGEGVALLPYFIVETALAEGRLVQVLDDWTPSELWLTLYYPPYERLPMRIARFSDFFEAYVTRVRLL
ncbi:LysR family transcriptional regulator [Martelella mediterranea]|uniref:D-malate degradation protein R n=1 Tax=Martelella mediterranea DSM 17316 TaxID=1122214 RepID=A0A1U9Z3H2_9HYPH|nr:LysR family transcriptional regulator [Martelella mediterranea]AQZ52218.1 D-malate degradation protein R [Martelella mediterranea DSM 17316]